MKKAGVIIICLITVAFMVMEVSCKKESAVEHEGTLGRADDIRGCARGADGQQRRRTDAENSGVVQEELLRKRSGMVR